MLRFMTIRIRKEEEAVVCGKGYHPVATMIRAQEEEKRSTKRTAWRTEASNAVYKSVYDERSCLQNLTS